MLKEDKDRLDELAKVPEDELTDKLIDEIWDISADAGFDEDRDDRLILAEDSFIWKPGTDREEIWHWFDEHHSKGVTTCCTKDRKEKLMTKAQLLDILDQYDDEEEVDLMEIERDLAKAHEAFVEELEERQHASGFYAFQDELAMMRYER